MKPADFEYHAPRTLDEVLALLAGHREDGRILAGGQSLVPMMNFRLARPPHLIDLNGVAELDFLRADGNTLRVGALTRHAAFHRPAAPGPTGKLLVARSRRGERRLKAAEYFHGTFATALAPDEVITEVRLPVLDESWRTGFYEFARRAGDFAIAMTAVAVRTAGKKISEARIAIGGVEDRPTRVASAEALLMRGASPAEAAKAVAAAVKPMEDIHADAAYRRDLVVATTQRALEQALA